MGAGTTRGAELPAIHRWRFTRRRPRNSRIVTLDGVQLLGEQDIFGAPWDSAAVAADEESQSAWSGGVWNGSSWAGSSWAGSSWAGSSWAGSSLGGFVVGRFVAGPVRRGRVVVGGTVWAGLAPTPTPAVSTDPPSPTPDPSPSAEREPRTPRQQAVDREPLGLTA